MSTEHDYLALMTFEDEILPGEQRLAVPLTRWAIDVAIRRARIAGGLGRAVQQLTRAQAIVSGEKPPTARWAEPRPSWAHLRVRDRQNLPRWRAARTASAALQNAWIVYSAGQGWENGRWDPVSQMHAVSDFVDPVAVSVLEYEVEIEGVEFEELADDLHRFLWGTSVPQLVGLCREMWPSWEGTHGQLGAAVRAAAAAS